MILGAGGRWSTEVLPEVLKRYGEDAADLSSYFERIRNAWMSERTDNWMALHQVGVEVGMDGHAFGRCGSRCG